MKRRRWRRWCEIRFWLKRGWWCEHTFVSPWQPIVGGFYSLRQCGGCGMTELR